MLSLTGLNGSVALDGRTVTVKCDSGGAGGKPIVLPADSIKGTAVWTGVLGGQFSVHHNPVSSRAGAASDGFLSVQFKAADKEWWDAMASAIMAAVRRADPAPGRPAAAPADRAPVADVADVADKAVADATPAAPSSFDGWLNRTLGLEASQNPASGER